MKVIQPREFNPRKTAIVLVVLAFAFYFYYQREPTYSYWRLRGETMGTTYTVKVLDRHFGRDKAAELKAGIDERLIEVNRQMSTYIPDSEISLFNRHDGLTPFPASSGFAAVTAAAVDLCAATGGAFDPTLDPLINAWGFGHTGPRRQPDPEELAAALALTGCGSITVSNGAIARTAQGIQLNLNAIAKGYGVDEVSRLIEDFGVTNYMVEIGGEVFARGISEKIRPWRIGIDRPVDGSLPGEEFDIVVEIDGVGLASSGNYRNYSVSEDGSRIAHLLDPRTGQPAVSRTASVSVIAPDCMTADALATALFVMGADEGVKWANRHDGIEAAFIVYGEGDRLGTVYSDGFAGYIFTGKPEIESRHVQPVPVN